MAIIFELSENFYTSTLTPSIEIVNLDPFMIMNYFNSFENDNSKRPKVRKILGD